MDIMIGKAHDGQYLPALFPRPCNAQAALLPGKTSSAVASTLDSLECALERRPFKRPFGIIPTDNGTELADTATIEASAFGGRPVLRLLLRPAEGR